MTIEHSVKIDKESLAPDYIELNNLATASLRQCEKEVNVLPIKRDLMKNPRKIDKDQHTLPKGFYPAYGKRLLDIFGVLAGAAVVVPVVLLLALIIFLQDYKNPFYSQQRVGRKGKLYTMWKLRSMIPNAHQVLDEYLQSNPAAYTEWETTQKLKKDPRVTPLGRLIRASSLDELPQLWNVFIGDMSLIGPRPILPEQRDLYLGKAYTTLRPGITGLWQVSRRNEASFVTRAKLDEDYAHTLSFKTDIKILFLTVWVVFCATGY